MRIMKKLFPLLLIFCLLLTAVSPAFTASAETVYYPNVHLRGNGAEIIDENGNVDYHNAVLDANGVPVLKYPFNLMTMQESLAATNPLNRFTIDASVGKLIYLKNRQSVSINLSVTNLTNNTHFKTGGYQQARLPRAVRQGEKDYQNSVITANAWKYPSKYYYAWGANFFLTVTYKF